MTFKVGDKVRLRYGDTGEVIGIARADDHSRGWWFGNTLHVRGPYIIRLEHGSIIGANYDDLRRLSK